MGALKTAALEIVTVVALPIAAISAPPQVARWQPQIAQASLRCGIPQAWIERVMGAESAGMTMLRGAPIRSSAGAIGLMGLMPATWATMKARLGLGSDPDDAHDNIIAGTCFLRDLYDRFGYPGLFAAYNAGPSRYARHIATGRPLPAETQTYLTRVASPLSAVPAPTASTNGLFLIGGGRADGNAPPATLFVPISTDR